MKFLKNEKILKLLLILLTMIALMLNCFNIQASTTNAETKNSESVSKEENISVVYSSHVQDYGWENDFSKENGQESGTTGQNKKNEAIKIKLKNAPNNVKIKYQVEVQDQGWQDWKEDGQIAGTTGQNKRMQAIKIQLKNAQEYSVEYRVHLQDRGWQDWVADGKVAGLLETQLKIEAIEIKIVPKTISVVYQTHIQDRGWQKYFNNGQTAGDTKNKLKIEAIRIEVKNLPLKVEYKTHVQDYGWEKDWKTNGEQSGTTGQNKKVEAIRIRLNSSEEYSILYRAYLQDKGWQDWKIDGELAGTTGENRRIEAIEIKIVKKQVKGKIEITSDLEKTKFYKNEDIKIEGWNLANIANSKFKVYIDNGILENCEIKQKQDENIYNEHPEYGTKSQNTTPAFVITIPKEIANNLTTGQHKVKLVSFSKDEKIEISSVEKTFFVDHTNFVIKYTTHVQDYGWQEYAKQEKTSGVIGQNKKIEAIKIEAKNLPDNTKIYYQSHVQDYGWEKDWKTNGEQSGTTGQNKKVEAVKIKLEGTNEYSIMYRTYLNGKGWQNWANDGEISGTTGQNRKVEAIEIKIVPKINENKFDAYLDGTIPQKVKQDKFKFSGWIMTNMPNTKIKILVDGKEITPQIIRTERQDVLDTVKGYGGEEKNPKPGFEFTVDFTNSELGNKNLVVQYIDEKGNILKEEKRTFEVCKKIETSKGIYGRTGLKVAGRGGNDLTYYKFGSGPNVFFATFAIHGFEDLWSKDGQELVTIANNFYNRLINDYDYSLADKWTIYIFPGVNQDGLTNGTTKDGPGRTTLYSQAPENKGIDLNRSWQIGSEYEIFTNSRNYNGTQGFQAYEAQALRDFLLTHKSQNGQTLLVDLHGWMRQLIGDPDICKYYGVQFPENDTWSIGRYGTQFMINWARTYLASNSRPAKTALIELPYQGVNGHQSVINQNFSGRYIEATLSMLRNII